jgi:hypothetical protein
VKPTFQASLCVIAALLLGVLMIDEREALICGKLTALEFVVEVMLANQMAHLTKDHSDRFLADLVSRTSYIRRGVVDVDDLQAIEAASNATLQNLAMKVSERAEEIRKHVAQSL